MHTDPALPPLPAASSRLSASQILAKACHLLAILLLLAGVKQGTAQIANRITRAVDSGQIQALARHHPQWATPANDLGAVPANQSIDGLTLVLTRSPQQEQAFEQLLADQQNPASPAYHHWLTPEEVGQRFGLSDADIANLSGWLQSQGLHVNWVAPSRMFIGFGGSAATVGNAFHTELHTYSVNGMQRMSVASDPMIPVALVPAIQAVRGLYSVEDRPQHSASVQQAASPDLTSTSGNHYLAPADFNTIYDVRPSLTGAGQTIGIVGWSRVDTADLNNFRQKTNTAFPNPTQIVPTAYGGIDPGPAYTSPPSACSNNCTSGQGEATLDVERAGSTAPGAQLLLVASSSAGSNGGIGADAQYLVQTSPVPAQVMNISFGACESSAGSSGVNFWNALFQQAAAEGISVFVSSGDSGASGCDNSFTPPPASPNANSPNYICSSSYATCVGGTQFNDTTNTYFYWLPNNGTGLSSADTYIPEGAWNESWNGTTSTVAASGGGVSTYIATPSWQTGTGVPAARSGRYTPDVSFAAAAHDGYFGCFAAGGASCVTDANTGIFHFVDFSGTSAAAPSMAGVAALLDQKLGSPQGNLNPGIYATAQSVSTAFHDTTVASSGVGMCDINAPSMCNNSIPGPTGLSGGQAGFAVGAGYDEVTGLGSLEVQTFLSFYSTKITPVVTVTPSPTSITQAQALPVTITVSGGSANPVPTGTVILKSGTFISTATTLSGGSATVTIPAWSLPAGTPGLIATYTPDSSSTAIYNSSSGMAYETILNIVPIVTVTPSSSTIPVTQGFTLAVSVDGGAGNPAPTGSVEVLGGGYTLGNTSLSNGVGSIAVPAGLLAVGTETLTAYYSPNNSTYNSATGSATVTITAAPKITPTVTVTPAYSVIASGQSLAVSIGVDPGAGNPSAVGTLTLTSGGYSASFNISNGSITVTIPAGSLAVGNDTLTAVYTPTSPSINIYNTASSSATVTVSASVQPPGPLTGGASAITTTTATLNGSSFTGGADTHVWFLYGTSSTLSGATQTASQDIGSGNTSVIFSASLTSLASGTTYYFEAAAQNSAGTSYGSIRSFTTANATPATFTVTGTNVTVTPGATSGNTSTITVTPSGNFTGAVALNAQVTGSPTGAQYAPTFSFGATSPVSITGTGSATATLTIGTTTATTAALARPASPSLRWLPVGGTALTGLLLIFVPTRRRKWRALLEMVAIMAIFSGLSACTSGSSVSGGTSIAGTTQGTYTITITGTSGATAASNTLTLTVQ